MNMSVSMESPASREAKRVTLAERLVSHGVRTRLIERFTGISRNSLLTKRRHWGIPETVRLRGRSPRALNVFFTRESARMEGSAMAALCRAFGATSEKGVELCEAYEAYKACFPNSAMEFEDVLMLMEGLEKGDQIRLMACRECGCSVLTERWEVSRKLCGCCLQA